MRMSVGNMVRGKEGPWRRGRAQRPAVRYSAAGAALRAIAAFTCTRWRPRAVAGQLLGLRRRDERAEALAPDDHAGRQRSVRHEGAVSRHIDELGHPVMRVASVRTVFPTYMTSPPGRTHKNVCLCRVSQQLTPSPRSQWPQVRSQSQEVCSSR